jgi:hypothetical protein
LISFPKKVPVVIPSAAAPYVKYKVFDLADKKLPTTFDACLVPVALVP